MEAVYATSDVLSNRIHSGTRDHYEVVGDTIVGASMKQETFGVWLGRQLVRREWTQADLARRTGISSGRISEWVRGTRLPNSESAVRLADALHENPDYVLALTGHRPGAFTDDDPDTAALISLIRKIHWDDFKRSLARKVLEAMLNGPPAAGAR